ncbi:phage minor tail protein L [Rhodoferax sp. TH121]|uniref:phage minor tail protein L n=1 Tax=Rhodoferax sp. TH121 TaxID=2022803 RepID=UPI000B96F258|nr:phage minor tail protein L [Rhodoferax sp. TH121]OYQ41105.1 phage minor tail protein L [Rhodoferax sp. TH121]
MVIESDVQKLAPGAIVDLFELDATALGGSVIRWHNGVNALGNDVVWQGNSYTRFPVEAGGFARSGQGSMPRPTMKVANVSGLVGALARELRDLCGAKVTRRRTFVKYLDAVNFPGGVNPQADPNVGFPNEVWFVDRKAAENGIYVEFELSAAFDVQGVKLPRRQCIQNVCTWMYRSAECGYAGGPVADKTDAPTSNPALDQCGKRLASCKLRFGQFEPLPIGSFPGVGLVR